MYLVCIFIFLSEVLKIYLHPHLFSTLNFICSSLIFLIYHNFSINFVLLPLWSKHHIFYISDASDCPPNWISHKDTCFTLKHITQTWSDGQKTCNFEQSNLASIESQEEFDFLKTCMYICFSVLTFHVCLFLKRLSV